MRRTGTRRRAGLIQYQVVGVATLSGGWHRPSDAVAALLIVGGWTCAASLFIIVALHRHGDVEYGRPNRFAALGLAFTGLALLTGAALAIELTNQVLSTPPDELSRYRLLVAYAGGAMGIAGTASLVLASVLATLHRVVPQAVPPRVRNETDAMVAASRASTVRCPRLLMDQQGLPDTREALTSLVRAPHRQRRDHPGAGRAWHRLMRQPLFVGRPAGVRSAW